MFAAYDSINEYKKHINESCHKMDIFCDECPLIIPLLKDVLFNIIYSRDCAKIFLKHYSEEKDTPRLKSKFNHYSGIGTLSDQYQYISMYPEDKEFNNDVLSHVFPSLRHLLNMDPGSYDAENMVKNFLNSFPDETEKIAEFIISYYPYGCEYFKYHIDKLLEIRPNLRENEEDIFFVHYVNKLDMPNRDLYHIYDSEDYFFSSFPEDKLNQTKKLILLQNYKTHMQIDKFLRTFPDHQLNIYLIRSRLHVYNFEKRFCYFTIMAILIITLFYLTI